jgi:hypothetical protein
MKKSFFINLIVLFLLSFSVVEAQNKKSVVPDGWKKLEACGITFYAPSDFEEENIRGKDSCVKSYRSKNILLTLDVLGYIGKESNSRKDELSDEKDFQIVKTKIDGRKAEIITYYETENKEQWKDLLYEATLFVPVIDKKDGGNLTIWTNSRTAENRETAKKIFATVRF